LDIIFDTYALQDYAATCWYRDSELCGFFFLECAGELRINILRRELWILLLHGEHYSYIIQMLTISTEESSLGCEKLHLIVP